MQLMRTAAALSAALFAACALAAGNTTNEDFRESKKMLERKVYFDHRVTLYCGYAYDKEKNVSLRNITIDSNDGLFQGYIIVGVNDTASLNQLIKKIKTVKGVKDVQRSK